MKRLEQFVADEVIEISHNLLEEMEDYLAGYHYATQSLVDLWVGPAGRALEPFMGPEYQRVKLLLVDSTKKAWSTYRHCHKESNLPLLGIKMQVSRNLREVISIAEMDFNIRSNIIVLEPNSED
jgi:hypothetical protein